MYSKKQKGGDKMKINEALTIIILGGLVLGVVYFSHNTGYEKGLAQAETEAKAWAASWECLRDLARDKTRVAEPNPEAARWLKENHWVALKEGPSQYGIQEPAGWVELSQRRLGELPIFRRCQ
ncbi:MAG: hypothetical protein G01um101433_621 [Parcubacteria group bacterium Gr01-1014_33]|nr:MAG: hypothetical protein G01um101433_621 [Parcubacteria group bacterium Gr01-1014_33]